MNPDHEIDDSLEKFSEQNPDDSSEEIDWAPSSPWEYDQPDIRRSYADEY